MDFKLGLFIVFLSIILIECKCTDKPEKRDDVEPIEQEKKKPDRKKLNNVKNNSNTPEKPRKRCCPYNFDSKLCRVIDDRVICGYEINRGTPVSNSKAKEYPNGCRLRGGRLECGYLQAPFTNFRRPPAWEVTKKHSKDSYSEEIKSKELNNEVKKKKTDEDRKPKKSRCVEINERIVCGYDI